MTGVRRFVGQRGVGAGAHLFFGPGRRSCLGVDARQHRLLQRILEIARWQRQQFSVWLR